ncbi:hypothetical protein [Chromobacterium amazonense]|uniref:hypothetical protein n=1 Tax=Chromobacterium amazonense TaxID=1382803 RepID=UPI001113EFA5|nr:hypothetical protein [Chromobacterium amazonense]
MMKSEMTIGGINRLRRKLVEIQNIQPLRFAFGDSHQMARIIFPQFARGAMSALGLSSPHKMMPFFICPPAESARKAGGRFRCQARWKILFSLCAVQCFFDDAQTEVGAFAPGFGGF